MQALYSLAFWAVVAVLLASDREVQPLILQPAKAISCCRAPVHHLCHRAAIDTLRGGNDCACQPLQEFCNARVTPLSVRATDVASLQPPRLAKYERRRRATQAPRPCV